MSEHIIKFYPVDNGDTTLIRLTNNTTMIFDCKIRSEEKNSDGYTIFNVKNDLLEVLLKRNGIPFVDMFGLTHPDLDHCKGYETNFYCGNPDKYDDDDKPSIAIIYSVKNKKDKEMTAS